MLVDDNGKPLALIEAKKTARNAEDGRTQAKLYADGLQKQQNLKSEERPVLFYTNGYDLWIWNDAEGDPPRKVHGFYSKDSLQYLHRPAWHPLTYRFVHEARRYSSLRCDDVDDGVAG